MRLPRLAFVALAAAASMGLAFTGCSEELPRDDAPPDAGRGDAVRPPVDAAADAPLPRGDRDLGIGLDLRRRSFAADVETIRDGGARATTVGYAWDEVERPYDAGTGDAATNVYHPGFHVASLVLSELETRAVVTVDAVDVGGPRLPVDLVGSDLAREDVKARFDRVTDYVLGQTADLDVAAYVVASDVERAFGHDSAQWASFATFFAHAAEHARRTRPGLRVGVAVSAGAAAVAPERLAPLWAASDVAVLTLLAVDDEAHALPPGDAAATLDRAVAAVPPRLPVLVRAAGYPTAEESGSDEGAQAAFVAEAFAAWDRNAARIGLLVFAPLHEHPESDVAALSERHGRTDPAFKAMLRSLGLRRRGGAAKPALGAVVSEARARGF